MSAVFLWFVHLAVYWNVRHSLSPQVDEMILSIIRSYLGMELIVSIRKSTEIPMKLTKMHQYGQIAQLHYRREK
ncbi:hypothetical protein ACDX66_08900 [Peribacillus frigoritolerans]